jgi:hypothetical protein
MAERGEVLNLGDGRYVPRGTAAPQCAEGVTGVTGVTHVTPVTEGESPALTAGSVTGSIEGCNPDVTLVIHEKERDLEDVSDRVTGVTPYLDNVTLG